MNLMPYIITYGLSVFQTNAILNKKLALTEQKQL
ncbi:hypothetical protein SAMN04488556_1214 [Halostagnicola kamekurae]|uniref:Uncharacterized protein n=1 Tax=Halostagnicola kamekurae TaxID=619731 RepID=A0A1I6QE39_9EURY|nr:hypothetical protein SAMN04488556_1214 [Halostagnicola kamekurae]